MRTQEEIVEKMNDVAKEDFFGFIRGDLLDALDFEHAKGYLKSGVTEEDWEKVSGKLRTDEDVFVAMRNYMAFAWEKANNERGLSAGRTMNHYYAWLWLIGQDELAEITRRYDEYGKPQLRRICAFLGLDARQWDV